MKRFAFACLFVTFTISLFSMQPADEPAGKKELFFQGHPCLPKEFYHGMYAKIVAKMAESPEAKSKLQEFVECRLKSVEELFQENKPVRMSCEMMAMLVCVHESNHGHEEAAAIISQYGRVVPELFAFAVRKKFGVRVDPQIALETWELKQISEEEYAALLEESYTDGDIQTVITVEEIHAHRMLCELAGIKPAHNK